MLNKSYLYFLILPVALMTCYFVTDNSNSSKAAPEQRRKVEVIGTFQSKTYPVSDHEHVLVFDVPDRFMPSRCWTYVNEFTRSSNMHCDFDQAPSTDLPERGEDLAR